MTPNLIIMLIVAGVLALALIIVTAVVADRKRTGALELVARDLGFTFIKNGSAFLEESFTLLHLFEQGHGKRIRNVMSGRFEDVDVLLFDYRYTTGGGRNQTTIELTVAAYRTPGAAIASFELRPEHFFHKIGQAFGYKDIDIDTYPQFSKRYLLRGEDEQAVRDCFKQQTLEMLEFDPGWSIEAAGQWMVLYRSNRRVKPGQIGEFLEKTWTLFLSFEV